MVINSKEIKELSEVLANAGLDINIVFPRYSSIGRAINRTVEAEKKYKERRTALEDTILTVLREETSCQWNALTFQEIAEKVSNRLQKPITIALVSSTYHRWRREGKEYNIKWELVKRKNYYGKNVSKPGYYIKG